MIGRYGASVGKVLGGKAGAYNVALVRLIFDPLQVNPRWARYFCASSYFQDPLKSISRSAQNGFNKDDLAEICFPFPPQKEQAIIAAKLDELFQNSRSAREELQRIPRPVERYKQAILAAAFRGDLTIDWRLANGVSFHKEWSQVPLGAVSADVRYGTTAKCHYEPKAIPVLRIPNVAGGKIDTSDLKYASFDEGEIKKLSLKTGDLLVVRSNGSLDLVGRSALATEDVAGYLFAGYLIRIRLDTQQVEPAFINFAFSVPSIREAIERLAKSTSGVNNINSEQLRALRLPKPPLPEQREIIRRLNSAFAHFAKIASEVDRASKLLDRLDQATLAKAFRGELSAQNDRRSSNARIVGAT